MASAKAELQQAKENSMKAKVKLALPGYTGKMDDMVIYFNSKLNCLVSRRYVKPAFTPSNNNFKAAVKLAKTLGISEGYLEDCRKYVTLYNSKNRRHGRSLSCWTNMFVRILLRLKQQFPELDLSSLTRQQILDSGYPCRTLAEAVEAGLLEKVNGYSLLVNLI
jgi:hypothetical protein